MRRVFAVLLALGVVAPAPAFAQGQTDGTPAPAPERSIEQEAADFTPSHLAAAQRMIDLTKSGEPFDDILPALANQTRARFTQADPSLAREIEDAVMSVAVDMAARRAELARVMQLIWARRFTEEELDELIVFFSSDVGTKFANLTPIISALTLGAARQWEEELSTQMVSATRAKLREGGFLQ